MVKFTSLVCLLRFLEVTEYCCCCCSFILLFKQLLAQQLTSYSGIFQFGLQLDICAFFCRSLLQFRSVRQLRFIETVSCESECARVSAISLFIHLLCLPIEQCLTTTSYITLHFIQMPHVYLLPFFSPLSLFFLAQCISANSTLFWIQSHAYSCVDVITHILTAHRRHSFLSPLDFRLSPPFATTKQQNSI